MRRMFEDDTHRFTLAAAAKNDMIDQPSLTHTGPLITGLCRDASDSPATERD